MDKISTKYIYIYKQSTHFNPKQKLPNGRSPCLNTDIFGISTLKISEKKTKKIFEKKSIYPLTIFRFLKSEKLGENLYKIICESTLNLNISEKLAKLQFATFFKMLLNIWLLILRHLKTKCVIVLPNTGNLKKLFIFTIAKYVITRSQYVIND